MPEPQPARSWRWKGIFHLEDFAWAFFIAILLLTAPERNNNALILVPLIGAFQIIEPRLRLFRSNRGQVVSVIVKLLLCYLLIGYSDAIYSYYYPIFLIPVVSAATTFRLGGVIATILAASAGYLSFLLLLPSELSWSHLPEGFVSLMCMRTGFYAIVGFLVYQQAAAKRVEMVRTREAEASLRRSERLAALGQLTAGLAHELRNPLGIIKASAEMLTSEAARNKPEVLHEMSLYISDEVDRMNGLIASFLNFARPLSMNASSQPLAPVLEEVARRNARSDIDVSVDVANAPLEFCFDAHLLSVALGNLVQNAVQASGEGQKVELRAASDGDLVRILVTDHGSGISPEHLENIFNPFFTTKPQGVGLGLALVSKIVDEHGGRINVFSEPGRGTTFEITLPREQPVCPPRAS